MRRYPPLSTGIISRKQRMSDTSPEVRAIQDESHRRMTGEERISLAIEMSEMARNMALSRLRKEHPEWTDWELKRQLLRYPSPGPRSCVDCWQCNRTHHHRAGDRRHLLHAHR